MFFFAYLCLWPLFETSKKKLFLEHTKSNWGSAFLKNWSWPTFLFQNLAFYCKFEVFNVFFLRFWSFSRLPHSPKLQNAIFSYKNPSVFEQTKIARSCKTTSASILDLFLKKKTKSKSHVLKKKKLANLCRGYFTNVFFCLFMFMAAVWDLRCPPSTHR